MLSLQWCKIEWCRAVWMTILVYIASYRKRVSIENKNRWQVNFQVLISNEIELMFTYMRIWYAKYRTERLEKFIHLNMLESDSFQFNDDEFDEWIFIVGDWWHYIIRNLYQFLWCWLNGLMKLKRISLDMQISSPF